MTELIWKGKSRRKEGVRAPGTTVVPLRVVEIVEVPGDGGEEGEGDLFTEPKRETPWRNLLVRGDNEKVMRSLLPRFAGKINLIYIDPPFGTGQGFSFRVQMGSEHSSDESSVFEERVYGDTWGGGLDSYLEMLYERSALMRELLAEDGSIYVHVGPAIVHYVKVMMDEIFGCECFRNEIVWRRDVAGKGAKKTSLQWPRNAEHILFYSRSETEWCFRQPYRELNEKQKRVYRYREPDGRRFKTVQLGDYSKKSICRMEREGLIYISGTGKKYKKYYLDEARDTVDCIWTDILGFGTRTASAEHLSFPTQKPEALLERIIEASSHPGDLIADFFCGSGTTGAVAERLGRRWILCDLSKRAVHVTRKRLLQTVKAGAFEVLAMQNYEQHKLSEGSRASRERYLRFILQLYGAQLLSGFTMLHGEKSEAYIHVGSPDGPVTAQEICQTLAEAKEAGVREVHFLGWEFEEGVQDVRGRIKKKYGVSVRLSCIPREALEVSNPEKEKMRFFDLNELELTHEVKGKNITVTIENFVVGNREYLPKEARTEKRHFSDFIDYWAVDWDYREDVFRDRWRSFRTRKKPKLSLDASHSYQDAGTYTILIKVVDIFANETVAVLTVQAA